MTPVTAQARSRCVSIRKIGGTVSAESLPTAKWRNKFREVTALLRTASVSFLAVVVLTTLAVRADIVPGQEYETAGLPQFSNAQFMAERTGTLYAQDDGSAFMNKEMWALISLSSSLSEWVETGNTSGPIDGSYYSDAAFCAAGYMSPGFDQYY
ncbi:MAG: hypothetical protein ACREM6_05570, partial [Vulcanimicrobiaceae bacterium]